jgi:putative tryptophan/tyrosine transport system substrate-binding protein
MIRPSSPLTMLLSRHTRRREFITLLGGAAAAWPLAARAQQPAMPVVGYLESRSPDGMTDRLRAFRQGLKDTGYVEGENVRIEYRWAENQLDRLPMLAAELVRQRVNVIATTGGPEVALAAKAATMTIPLVFGVTEDPVPYGLVASHSRPGGNATGVNFLITELESKRLGLLHELIPAAARVGLLVNPKSLLTERTMRDVTTASSAIGLQVDVVQASDSREIESVFKTLVDNKADALLVGPDAFFVSRRLQLAILAARHALPAVYNVREYAEAGRLMSYGTNARDAYREIGVYVGRILNGATPADLPVVQSSKFELVINLPTARALGIEVPPNLLARADEVIE